MQFRRWKNMQNVDHDVDTPANKKYNVHKDRRITQWLHDIWNFAALGYP